MRIAALVIGIIGGVIGLLAATTAGLIGGAAGALSTDTQTTAQATEIAGRGGLGVLLSILAMVGAAFAMAKPRFAAVVLALTGFGGLLAVGGFYLLAGPLLLVAALLAFLGRHPTVTRAATTP